MDIPKNNSKSRDTLFETPDSEFPSHFKQWKDELNLAEFPIAALTTRVDPNQKTLEFTDEIHDNSTGELINRRLTISASDKYGLPTAIDDEIILGLIQISRLGEFASQEVTFSRYQLLETLGWKQTTRNYQRIEIALQRWIGVTLYYQNAWRDRKTNEWVDAHFHILDNAEIYKKGSKTTFAPSGRCYIKWNQNVFRNFQAGNFKRLDFEVFRRLKSNISKRLYRFLDKRFGQRSKWSFRLEKLAFEKLGLSRSYSDMGQVKRRLAEAIAELEEVKFLKPMEKNKRFEKVSKGLWRVHFEKYSETEQRQRSLDVEVSPLSEIEAKLLEKGVTEQEARRLATEFPEEFLADKIAVVEFKQRQTGAKPFTNAAGYLVKSIRENYVNPPGFKTSAEKRQIEERTKQIKEKREQQLRDEEDKRRREIDEAEKANEEAKRKIANYLGKFSANEQEKIKEEAFRIARVKGAKYIGKGGMFAEMEEFSALLQFVEKQEELS